MKLILCVNLVWALLQIAPQLCVGAEDARVLPEGRSRLNFIYARTANISETFNNEESPESVTEPYQLELNSRTLSKLSPQLNSLIQVLNNTGWRYNTQGRDTDSRGLTKDSQYPGLGDALSRGYLGVEAQGVRQQSVLGFQHGVTSRLTLGFMVPWVRNQIQVRPSISGSNTAKDIYAAFASGSGVSFSPEAIQALNQIQNADINTLQALLGSLGYAPVQDSDITSLGDLVLGGRYLLTSPESLQGPWTHSVQAGLILPTGRLKPTQELAQVDAGQGSTDLNLAEVSNYRPNSWLLISSGLHFTHRFWGHRTLRVRPSPSTLLPGPEDEENLSQKLGDKFWYDLGADWKPNDSLTLGVDYEWWWKAEDRFLGQRTDRDYTYLSDRTQSKLETLQVTLAWSTIGSFLRGQSWLPLSLSASVFLPLRGKNAIIAPYSTAELALYF